MNPRLRIALILLLARAGWTGAAGLTFVAVAAIFWISRPMGPPSDSQLIGDVLAMVIAGGLGLLGVAALAIAIPSFAFAFLLRTGKQWATWTVVVGESVVAIALVVATVWALTHSGDQFLAVATVVAIAIVSAPVIVLLVWTLAEKKT